METFDSLGTPESFAAPIGGFASQRLTAAGATSGAAAEKTVAFRIGPAATTPLTAPLEFYKNSGGIFKCIGDGGVTVDDSVFETLGVQYLKDTAGRRLMLLDEIGGHELKCAPFMDALLELLSGDIPCLGVFKMASSVKRMDSSLMELNARLREAIINSDGRILYYERGDEAVRAAVEDFVSKIF